MSSIISFLQENAQRYSSRPALSDFRQTISYRELWQKIRKFASLLSAQGFSHGVKIVVEADSSISFVIAAMGISLAGSVFVPVEKNISKPLAHRFIEETGARLFIGKEKIQGVHCMTFSSMPEEPETGGGEDSLWKMPEEESISEILYTTGTSGISKGVVLSHNAVFSSSVNSSCADKLDAESVYLIASPLNHINGLRKLYSCFLCGAHAVLLDGFLDVKKYYESIEKYRVNILLLPPSAVRFLLFVSKDKLHSFAGQIKTVHTNSAPLTETDKTALHRCLPNSRLIFGYGATEAGSVCSAYNYAEFQGMVNCVGRPSPHTQITIVDENHREISSSKENPGYLAVSGDSLMNGYLNDPGRTSEVLQKNFLYTNDLGYTDENGFVFVLGRRGDMINSGGLKVAPSEVENAVMHYSGIRDCACFGVKDRIAGESVKLNIVPEDGIPFDLKEFRKFLRDRLERHQIPVQIERVAEIPKTPNGKIDRKRLK